MATRPLSFAEDDPGIADLVGRLADDSKRLVSDEVRLAKLEAREAARATTRGGLWLAVAFGAAVVALTALTVLSSVLLGRLFDNLWAGTLLTGAMELLSGYLLLRHGLSLVTAPSFTLEETRGSLADTARWARNPTPS